MSVLIGVGQDEIHSWEASRSRPSLDQTVRSAAFCGTPSDRLLGRNLVEEALLVEAKHG